MSKSISKISHNAPVFEDNDPQDELITLNIGPTHPATHGVFQNVSSVVSLPLAISTVHLKKSQNIDLSIKLRP